MCENFLGGEEESHSLKEKSKRGGNCGGAITIAWSIKNCSAFTKRHQKELGEVI